MSPAKHALLFTLLTATACSGLPDAASDTTTESSALTDVNNPGNAITFLMTPAGQAARATSTITYKGTDNQNYCAHLFIVARGLANVYQWHQVPYANGNCQWGSTTATTQTIGLTWSELSTTPLTPHTVPVTLLADAQGLFAWNWQPPFFGYTAELHRSLEFRYLDMNGTLTTIRMPARLSVNNHATDFAQYSNGVAQKCVRVYGNQFVTTALTTYQGVNMCNWLPNGVFPAPATSLAYLNSNSQFATATINGTTFNPNPIGYRDWSNAAATMSILGFTPPAGPYTSTCAGITFDGIKLAAAQCLIPGGALSPALISDFSSCSMGDSTSHFNNVWGALSCFQDNASTKTDSYPAFVIPPGSYQKSCISLRAGSQTLSALCRDKNGNWQTNTDVPIGGCLTPDRLGDIQNNNGFIACF
ncbi:MAG TPA: hypothetical protein VIF57_29430 [Polyangia bacterium]